MNWLRFTVLPFLFLCVAIAAQEVTAQEPSSSSNAIKEINAVAASLDNIMLHLDAIIEQAQQHKIAVKKVQALLKELLANPERLQKYKIQRTKGELGLKSLMLEEAITSIDLHLLSRILSACL